MKKAIQNKPKIVKAKKSQEKKSRAQNLISNPGVNLQPGCESAGFKPG